MRSTMQDVPLTVTAILRHAADVAGDRLVTTAMGRGRHRTTTYRELGEQAARLAGALRGLGVTGDDRVGTFMWNNAEHLTAYVAVPAMGAVLHTLNIRLSPEQIAFIANEAEDRVVLVDLSLATQFAAVLPLLKTVHTVIAVGDGDMAPLRETGRMVVRYDDALAGRSASYDWPRLDESSAAAMCYTSGTTGNPKGVVYSHRSVFLHAMALCSANQCGYSVDDSALPIVPMFHANAWGIPYAAMMAGADLVLPDRFLDAESLLDLIEARRPTIAAAVPTIWNDVLAQLNRTPDRDLSSLRVMSSGGSAVPRSLIEAFNDKGIELLQCWGMTETSPVATVARPLPGVSDEERARQRGSQGRAVCGVEMRIVDDAGDPLPHDGVAVGEVEARGAWVTGSYYLNHDASKFNDGWLRTGDVGRIDALGYVTLTDRAKDVIKSGGEWISSVELENHLVAHHAVREAAVVAVPDERWSERPLAVVVLDAAATPRELRDFLAQRVVRWWLPERWAFVDEVPRTSVGKYDKKAIRARHAAGDYDVTECRD